MNPFVVPVEGHTPESHGAVDLYVPSGGGPRPAIVFVHGGPLMADWLRLPPSWLRCVAANYPVLASPSGVIDARFQPVEALKGAGTLPIVLIRAGREHPSIAATVETFIHAARASAARLEVIDVPDGRHGFDYLDHNEQSLKAVQQALNAVLTALDDPPDLAGEAA